MRAEERVWEERSARLREMGYDPDAMSVGERAQALGEVPEGPSFFELLGMREPEYSRRGNKSRFASEYVEHDGSGDGLEMVDAKFWCGVREGVRPCKPVRRQLTSCYSAFQVYYDGEALLFDAYGTLYHVPECEEWALQANSREHAGFVPLSDVVDVDNAKVAPNVPEIHEYGPIHATVWLKRAKRPSEPPKTAHNRPITAFVRAAEAVSEPPKTKVATVAQNGRKRRSCVVTGRQSNLPWLKVMGEYWKNDKRAENTSQTGLAMAF